MKKFLASRIVILAVFCSLAFANCDIGGNGGTGNGNGTGNGDGNGTGNSGPFITAAKYREMVSIIETGTVSLNQAASPPSEVFISGRNFSIGPYAIAKYETTYELWKEVYDWALKPENGYAFDNPGYHIPGVQKTRPVTYISWRDAVVWCNAYSEMSEKTPVYVDGSGAVLRSTSDNSTGGVAMKDGANGFRLPTEAEWEYAARGATLSGGLLYAGSNTIGNVAWYSENSKNKGPASADYGVHPAGQKNPNGKGLYDMSGNVLEWCWDRPNNIYTSTPADGGDSTWDSNRAWRGGSWTESASYCTVAYRSGNPPGNTNWDLGFRVARDL